MTAATCSASPAIKGSRHMVRSLLIRGMLVGIIAGLLTFAFLKIFGEPPVDQAIAFESQMVEAQTQADTATLKQEPEPELVSRSVQAGIGLFTGVVVYSAAFGGLFALAFAGLHGRIGTFSPRATSALLAAAGFIALYLVPFIKYPANPPAVGEAETIQIRTALHFLMIAISLAAMIGSAMLRNRLVARHGAWNASLIAGAAYLVVIIVACLGLPGVNEIPEQFPAIVLWQFRVASIGAQLVMWATLGLAFGALTERAARGSGQMRFVGS
jgi:predicted cobalt transporter CbtA